MKMRILVVAALAILPIAAIQARAGQTETQRIAKKYHVDLKTMKPISIRIATLAPADTPWIRFPMDHVIKRINEESEGAMKIQVFAGGTMGEDTDILRKMRLGQLQGCGCTALGVHAAVPELSVFSVPLLFKNYDEVDHIFKKFRPEIDRMFLKRGYRLMALIDTGFFYLYTREKISSIEDLKRQKVDTWFGEIEKATLNDLDVSPLPVPVPEVTTSLQTGLINANIGPLTWQLATQAYLYTHYYVDTPLFYSPAAVMFEEKQLKDLEKDYPPGFAKEILDYIGGEMLKEEMDWRGEVREYEKKCLQALNNAGRTPITLSPDDMSVLRAAAEKVKVELAGKMYSEAFLDKVEKALNAYRAKTLLTKKKD